MTEPRTADDLMATEWHRERARVWREGEPGRTQFDPDPPSPAELAEEAYEREQAERRRKS